MLGFEKRHRPGREKCKSLGTTGDRSEQRHGKTGDDKGTARRRVIEPWEPSLRQNTDRSASPQSG